MLKSIIDNGVKSEGYKHIRSIFEELGLTYMFDFFYENNNGRNNPYHNNTHTFIVVDLVDKYCFREHIGGQLKNCLLIAALFHDFNHSGGKLEDKENVEIAWNGLWEFWSKNHGKDSLNKDKTRILQMNMILVCELIKQTEYPYKEVKSDLHRIIREADILSYEHEEWYKYVYQGLCKELGKDSEGDDKKKLLNNMLEFHSKLVENEIKLPFFKDIKRNNFESFIEDVNKII